MTKRDKLMIKVGIDDTLFDPYASEFAKNRWKYAKSHKDYVDWFTPYRRLSKRQHFFKNFSLPIPCKYFIIYQVFTKYRVSQKVNSK